MLAAERAAFQSEAAATAAAAAAAAAAAPPAPSPAPPPLHPVGPPTLGLSYCAAFLSPAEASSLVAVIDSFPASEWASLTKRRLLNLGGVPHPSGSWAEPLPPALVTAVAPRLAALGVFPAAAPCDQILLNEYRDGAGIGGHKDGPLFLPKVAIVSLGGDALLHFSRVGPAGPPCASVLLRAGSLVVFEGEAYDGLHHYIADAATEVINDVVVNLAAAGAAAGEVVARPARRLSLTLRRLAHVERAFGRFDAVPADVEEERRRRRRWWLGSISESVK